MSRLLYLLSLPLVSQFIEKRREMKQEGRTEQELAESYCLLYPDKSKVGLSAKSHRHEEDKPRRFDIFLSFECSFVYLASVDL